MRKRKKYDPKAKLREQAARTASKYLISAVCDLGGAVYVFNDKLAHVMVSKSTAAMINNVRHHWSFVCCVAGRYKNGKVWVRYEQVDTTVQATADVVSPLFTSFVEDFFEEQDKDTRLCKWWLAKPCLGYVFTAEEVMLPVFKADVFRAFINKNEETAGKEYGNHPRSVHAELSFDEFKEWWDFHRSPRSQVQELWIEG